MPVSDDEPVCPKFQPNIFDSSRCHDCLRQRTLHSDAAVATGGAHRPSAAAETGSAFVPQVKGLPLLPIPVEEEERDTSAKDSDSLSVVSSYCDVRGGRLGYAESSVCILSPDCELYICDGDDGDNDSTESCCEHSVYTELSDSVSAEDDYLPIRRRPTRHSTMTRLDPPPHRPNPRAWMDEARSRDGFGRNSGLKGERENRESGYFSLGRASGARSFKDKSPPPPFRHYERGHPLYSTRDTEPKATVPFRNPNLGLASERLNPEVLYQEVPLGELSPPDPYDIAVEVEARVGARSPSPTPFKIAESLASPSRRGVVSKGPLSSSYQPPGRFDSSRQGSALHSRSSSPSRENMPFKRAESTTSLSGRGLEGRGWQQGRDQSQRGLSQSLFGKVSGSGTLPRNFKSFPNPVKSQANCFNDFKSTLRKTDVNGATAGRGLDIRNTSPSRRGYETPNQTPLRKTESSSGALNGHGREGSLPPTSRGSYDTSRDAPRFSSPARRSYDTASQPLMRKSESVTSLNVHGRPPRCGSPIREGYDIESQSLLRNSETRSSLNEHERESYGAATTRRGNDTQGQSPLRRSEPNAYGDGGGRGIRESPSLPRRSYEASGQSGQSLLRKAETNSSVKSRGLESRNPSPSRRGYDSPGQTGLRKSEATASVRSHSHSRESRGPSPSRRNHEAPVQSVLRKTETSSSLTNNRSHNSRRSSPPRRNDPPGQSSLRKPTSRESVVPYQSNTTYSEPDANPSPRSWRGSSHNLHDSSLSQVTSPSIHIRENTRGKSTTFSEKAVNTETTGESSIRIYSGGRGLEARSSSPDYRRPSHRIRSPSPRTRRHASSQSSGESSESGQLSEGSTGRNKEEYAVLADLPKVKRVLQRDVPGHAGRPQHHLFKPASHSLSRHPSREWEDQADLERQEHTGSWLQGSSGRLSRAQSSTSIYIQSPSSPDIEEESSRRSEHRLLPQHMQPDLLNFKKGWMSKLDDNGEWKKHWFVLTDAGLRYYRDSGAEEKDDLDGDIDLKSCIKVSEFDVEKNYGFQIQTREAVFTLSAMTAGIRRNWIEVLRKSIRPSSSPDLTQLPDSSSDKENSHSRPTPSSSRRPSSRLEIPTSAPPTSQRKFDYVELSPVPVPALSNSPLPASQREAGEGQGREHAQWQEERNQEATSSQWEAVLTRKGTPPDPKLRMEDEIERRWAEFERLPLKEMRSLPAMGVSRPSQPANETLRREVASLRHQLERLRGGGGGGGGCGPEAPCSRSLASMERAHRQALEELQRQQERQVREMEEERDRLLREETRDTAQVIEALKKAHREEIEREVEKAKRLGGMVADPQSLQAHQQAEAQSLQRELAGLSERYSQKCLELNRAEQSNALREREISRKEKDMEQLKKENQELQSRLTEEITRMRTIVTGRGLDKVSNDDMARSSCGLEVLLRVKENELQYLQKEASCLRNELQFLNTEKRLACERYNEVHEELTGMKGRCEREIQSLKEHLRLAMAALQEGQRLGNSLEH